MGISAPSFDYQSLNAPGGIGQGLGALSGALVDAAARRRQAEAAQARLEFEKQGLARLEARDLASRSQEAMRFQEGVDHNRAQEEYQQGQLKRQDGLAALADRRYTEGVTRQKTLDTANAVQQDFERGQRAQVDAASIAEKNARAKYYSTPKTPSQPKDNSRAVNLQYEALAEKQAQRDFDDGQLAHSAAVAKADGVLWNDPMPPAPPTLEALRAKYRKNFNLPLPGETAAPTASPLRSRFAGMYPGGLPPEVELSLSEAEGGDQASAAQLERMLQQYDAGEDDVAPGGELDLLGNPR